MSQIAKFFEQEKPARAFLWVHFFEPHEPYEKRPAHDFGNGDVDRYDSEIAYTDAAVGRLLRYLDKHRPGAIVILTADHGEEFDEHGGRYHGTTLYDEQIRVPLIIAVPGVPPHVVRGPVELVDLAPTVLGLLDIPVPVRMRGTDLGPWLASPPAPDDRLAPAFAEVDEQRMVASARDKLICDVAKGFCAYYDLVADPGERRNLAEAQPGAGGGAAGRAGRLAGGARRVRGAGPAAAPGDGASRCRMPSSGRAWATPGRRRSWPRCCRRRARRCRCAGRRRGCWPPCCRRGRRRPGRCGRRGPAPIPRCATGRRSRAPAWATPRPGAGAARGAWRACRAGAAPVQAHAALALAERQGSRPRCRC